MDDGTFEVVAGLAILYAVIRLLKMIFDFIMKIVATRKENDQASKHITAAERGKCLSDSERIRIMQAIDGMSSFDWKMIEQHIKEMHDWHDVEDDDGVKRWYITKSMRSDVRRTKDDMSQLKDETARLADRVRQLSESHVTSADILDRLLQVVVNSRQ